MNIIKIMTASIILMSGIGIAYAAAPGKKPVVNISQENPQAVNAYVKAKTDCINSIVNQINASTAAKLDLMTKDQCLNYCTALNKKLGALQTVNVNNIQMDPDYTHCNACSKAAYKIPGNKGPNGCSMAQ